jgi:hypothetical protein
VLQYAGYELTCISVLPQAIALPHSMPSEQIRTGPIRKQKILSPKPSNNNNDVICQESLCKIECTPG